MRDDDYFVGRRPYRHDWNRRYSATPTRYGYHIQPSGGAVLWAILMAAGVAFACGWLSALWWLS